MMFYKTALHIAVENENVEIVKLLLNSPSIDVNSTEISNKIYLFIKFRINFFTHEI